MSIIRKGRTSVLDPKTCFDLWIELGTINAVSKRLYDQGVKNFKGNQFAHNSIWNAAYRFVTRNPEEARKDLLRLGAKFSDREWDEFIIDKIFSTYRAAGANTITKYLKKTKSCQKDIAIGYANKEYLLSKHGVSLRDPA